MLGGVAVGGVGVGGVVVNIDIGGKVLWRRAIEEDIFDELFEDLCGQGALHSVAQLAIPDEKESGKSTHHEGGG